MDLNVDFPALSSIIGLKVSKSPSPSTPVAGSTNSGNKGGGQPIKPTPSMESSRNINAFAVLDSTLLEEESVQNAVVLEERLASSARGSMGPSSRDDISSVVHKPKAKGRPKAKGGSKK